MSEPLFVCHICAPGEVGGLERVVQGLALGQHRSGLRSEVISVIEPGEGPHAFAGPLREGGVPVHEVRLPGRAVLAERRAVRDLLEGLSPDVLHVHGYRPDILHGTTARSLGIPTVSTSHGSTNSGGKTAFFEWLQTRLMRRAGAVVAVSTPIARKLEGSGVPPRLIHVIPNAWVGGTPFLSRDEAREALGIEPERRVVAFVGRLWTEKGPDVFVEALLRVSDPSVLALVIGDGFERSRLEARVREAGQEDRFRFMGSVNPAAPLFRAFDLFVLSSRTEGTPIVLFEAMASGVPTVVTPVGGVPDVVGQDGALVVPSEDPEALARAVQASLDDPRTAQARARSALERLEAFGADPWLERHERLYRSLTRGGPGADD
ncbi:MAG: glycosyltransferase [Gemmatimonadota bacterium]